MSDTDDDDVGTFDFEAETQSEIAALAIRDDRFMEKAHSLIRPEYFENRAESEIIKIGKAFYESYKTTPSLSVWKTLASRAAAAGRFADAPASEAKLEELLGLDVRSIDWIQDQVESFAQHKAIEMAMRNSIKHMMDKADPDRFQKIKRLMENSFSVGLASMEDDYDYFAEIANRTQKRKDIASGKIKKSGISTGIPELDSILMHGGWGLEELSLLMGGAKASKSFHLSFFAAKAIEAGKKVLFITLENSIEVTSTRIDAYFSKVGISDQFASPLQMEVGVENVAANDGTGPLRIRRGATGEMTPSQVERIILDYRAKGITFDLLVVDYLDIMAPDIRSQSTVENSASIYKAMRAIAIKHKLALLSATQMNREGHKSTVGKAEHVAEDFNRIRIADIVIAINRTEEERAENKARLTFAASRNTPDALTIFVTQDLDKGEAIASVDSVE